MIARGLQLIFALALAGGAVRGEALAPGSVASVKFLDVDGIEHATAAGKVTIIAVVTREHEDEAEAVADHVPDKYTGDSNYRYLTLVNFQRKLAGPFRGLTRAIIRQRLNAEARKLAAEYQARKIAHSPREDVIAVADFDGSEVAKLGLAPEDSGLAVFVFDGRGRVVQRWFSVPSEDSLGKAIAAAAQSLQ